MASNATSSSRLPIAERRRAGLWPVPPWVAYVACWLLVGVYQGLNATIGAGSDVATWKPFVWEMSSVLIILLLVPLVFRFEQRFRIDSRPRTRIVIAHAAGLIAFSAVHTTVMVMLRQAAYAAMGESYDFGSIWVRGFYELQKDVILYAVILTVFFAMREFRVRRASELRASQLAAEVGEARLRQLTAQIEPHFLFNSLNAISNRMFEDVHAADRMMTQLGDLLRAAYESDTSVLVPLSREVGWLRSYTAMMAERFRGKLEHSIDVEPGLDDVRVPRLLLQPLVENALKHGLSEGAGRLSVSVRRRGGDLEYGVSDDGVGLSGGEPARGTGLTNVSRRLELLFADRHALVVTPREPHGVTVTVRFPASE
jgi:two-component system, LytTR family, sensor kinase